MWEIRDRCERSVHSPRIEFIHHMGDLKSSWVQFSPVQLEFKPSQVTKHPKSLDKLFAVQLSPMQLTSVQDRAGPDDAEQGRAVQLSSVHV